MNINLELYRIFYTVAKNKHMTNRISDEMIEYVGILAKLELKNA